MTVREWSTSYRENTRYPTRIMAYWDSNASTLDLLSPYWPPLVTTCGQFMGKWDRTESSSKTWQFTGKPLAVRVVGHLLDAGYLTGVPTSFTVGSGIKGRIDGMDVVRNGLFNMALVSLFGLPRGKAVTHHGRSSTIMLWPGATSEGLSGVILGAAGGVRLRQPLWLYGDYDAFIDNLPPTISDWIVNGVETRRIEPAPVNLITLVGQDIQNTVAATLGGQRAGVKRGDVARKAR